MALYAFILHAEPVGCLRKNMSARDNSGPKTSLAVNSTEFCQCTFDKSNIRECLGGGQYHGCPNLFRILVYIIVKVLPVCSRSNFRC
jgi:hypothetical protein